LVKLPSLTLIATVTYLKTFTTSLNIHVLPQQMHYEIHKLSIIGPQAGCQIN